MTLQRGLLILAPCLGLGLVACTPTVQVDVVCGHESPDGTPSTAAVPEGSFEGGASTWLLGPTSAIDDSVAHEGSHSLRVQLNQGLGSGDVTRSGNFSGIEPNTEYEVCFYYRFEHCNAARFTLHAGDYEHTLAVDGAISVWTHTSLVVQLGQEPAWVEITAERQGAAGDFASADYDNNLFWIDDIQIAPN